jgi:hypothetical protein
MAFVVALFVKSCVHDERSAEKLRQPRKLSKKDGAKLGNQIAADLVKISEQPRSDQIR